jgi:predicted ArsR family transcriptional regulator
LKTDLSRGQERAAAKRAAIGKDIDQRVEAALAEGVPANAKAVSARLGLSYHQARRALIRLDLWKT